MGSILFIDFLKNLEETRSNKSSFFNRSLKQQYESIKNRISPQFYRPSALKDFIEICFPTSFQKPYSFACPNFARVIKKEENAEFLNNVVIWPYVTEQMKQSLPHNTNVMLIGDIKTTDRYKTFIVKGIELMDINLSTSGNIYQENSISCCHSFSMGITSTNVKYQVWSIDRPPHEQSIFTPDFIANLIKVCFPVRNNVLSEVFKTFEVWKEYLKFRNDYLKSQTLRYYPINQVQVLTAFSINRHTYRQHASDYEDLLLVTHKEFSKGEQILLSQAVSDSEEIKLIRVDIDKNYRDYETFNYEANTRIRNRFDSDLRAFTRDNLALSAQDPKVDSYLKNAYALDDKYKLITEIILPDNNAIIARYKELADRELKKVEDRHRTMIEQEVLAVVDNSKRNGQNDINKKLADFQASSIARIAQLNLEAIDPEIVSEIDRLTKLMRKALSEETQKEINRLNKKDKLFDEKKEKLLLEDKERLASYRASIDIKQLYKNEFDRKYQQLDKKLNDELTADLERIKRQAKAEAEIQHEPLKRQDIAEILLRIENEQQQVIEERKKEKRIIRYSIFFKVEKDDAMMPNISEYKYLVFDSRAEEAKIRRQESALTNLFQGNVKNPFLSTYLFSPSELQPTTYDYTDWEWYLSNLNRLQQEAVRNAVASNGIYLIQGPPGTGKTQVIAEIVGHLVQNNKKVLIASETHKAIDNVFDRLPSLADIRPLRLIQKSGKLSQYGPEKLVDNFYMNISTNMKKEINIYNDFAQYKDEFYDIYQKNNQLNERIKRSRNSVKKIDAEIQALQNKIDQYKQTVSNHQEHISAFNVQRDVVIRTRRHLEKVNFNIDDDIDQLKISKFVQEAAQLIRGITSTSSTMREEEIRYLLLTSPKQIQQEIDEVSLATNSIVVEQQLQQIRAQITKLTDEETGSPMLGYDNKVSELRKQLTSLKQLQNNTFDVSQFKVLSFITTESLSNKSKLINDLFAKRDNLIDLRGQYYHDLDDEIERFDEKIEQEQLKVSQTNMKIYDINNSIKLLREDIDFQNNKADENNLRRAISRFIETFGKTFEYASFDEAINIMHQQYLDLEIDFQQKQVEYLRRVPILKKISNYLSNVDVIEADRAIYTKDLFEKANLYGITTSSGKNYRASEMSNLSSFNLDNIDLSHVGIDTVIIDEVSKSSFIELLNPILFGKSIILVGDHRQLPPMYEFAKLRSDDFDHIDANVLTEEQNRKFTAMYQTSFFKTLFELVPSTYKTMLNQQYRSHEHIMNVYNCFYNGKLMIGKPGQNSEKEHFLSIVSNNRVIISPEKHVYFVDCKKYETKDPDGTSISNSNEADVVVRLLNLINENYKTHKNPVFTNDNDKRMSVGVICTYGDQARLIKNRIKGLKFDMFNAKPDSRLIVSTVDDFQGDERDIIILSMVRSPEPPARSDPGFVTAYQRVNVALSRARRLLIVVGNRNYLETKGVIDLPDVFGDVRKTRKDFHMYEEIIGNILRYGSIIDDVDVLGGIQ